MRVSLSPPAYSYRAIKEENARRAVPNSPACICGGSPACSGAFDADNHETTKRLCCLSRQKRGRKGVRNLCFGLRRSELRFLTPFPGPRKKTRAAQFLIAPHAYAGAPFTPHAKALHNPRANANHDAAASAGTHSSNDRNACHRSRASGCLSRRGRTTALAASRPCSTACRAVA